MAGLLQQVQAGKKRKLNSRLRKFFACSERAYIVKDRFNSIYFSDIIRHQCKYIPQYATVDSLLDNPVLPKVVRAIVYDESTATAVIHLNGQRKRRLDRRWRSRIIKAGREFNHTDNVIAPFLPRTLRV